MFHSSLAPAYDVSSSDTRSNRVASTPCDIYETYNIIQFRCFILDIRSPSEFAEGHIYGSHNLPIALSISKNPNKKLPKIVHYLHDPTLIPSFTRQLKETRKVIIISSHTQGLTSISDAFDLLLDFHLFYEDRSRENPSISRVYFDIYHLGTKLDVFSQIFPFLCLGKGREGIYRPLTNSSHLVLSEGSYPNVIIADELYLGNFSHSQNINIMAHLGITHIVNVTISVGNKFEKWKEKKPIISEKGDEKSGKRDVSLEYLRKNKIKYLHIRIDDYIYRQLDSRDPALSTTLYGQFPSILEFMDDALGRRKKGGKKEENMNPFSLNTTEDEKEEKEKERKGRVFVHCMRGVSRSSTVCIAYLMATLKMKLIDAYNYVHKCRPIIYPNFTFFKELLEFEKDLFRGKGSKYAFETHPLWSKRYGHYGKW